MTLQKAFDSGLGNRQGGYWLFNGNRYTVSKGGKVGKRGDATTRELAACIPSNTTVSVRKHSQWSPRQLAVAMANGQIPRPSYRVG